MQQMDDRMIFWTTQFLLITCYLRSSSSAIVKHRPHSGNSFHPVAHKIHSSGQQHVAHRPPALSAPHHPVHVHNNHGHVQSQSHHRPGVSHHQAGHHGNQGTQSNGHGHQSIHHPQIAISKPTPKLPQSHFQSTAKVSTTTKEPHSGHGLDVVDGSTISFEVWQDEWLSKHASTCGEQSIEPNFEHSRIIGGMEAEKGSWPWMASIFARNLDQHICAGSLIDRRWILTAAHCFRSFLYPFNKTLEIRLGVHNSTSGTLDSQKQVFGVKEVIIHPDFNSDTLFNNDIALVKLSRSARITDYVQHICITDFYKGIPSPRNRQTCVITGWGRIKKPDNSQINIVDHSAWPNLLNQAIIPIVSDSKCRQIYHEKVTGNMLCAGYDNGGVDMCNGDSGGPIQCQNIRNGKWFVQGITSWGGQDYNSCAEPAEPGVYTRASKYSDWIMMSIFKHRF